MRRTSFLLLGLTLAAAGPVAAASLVVPEIAVTVVDHETGRPLAGVDVALLVREGKRDDYSRLSAATTGADGRARFAPTPAGDLGFFAVEVSWPELERPRRGVVYQAKAKKGEKTAGGRLARPGKTKALYELGDSLEGDCENLFSADERGSAIEVVFRKPANYSECQGVHFKHADVANVGLRDINHGALNLYSFNDDRAMGRQFVDSLGPEQPLLDDPLVTGYVVDLVQRIGRASDLPDLEYQVQVIDADVLNAFALPGGYVFVYRGLLEATENESELVGVLAHEIGHVTGRHGTEGVTSAMGKMVGAMVIGGLLAEELTDNESAQELIQGVVMAGTNFWVLGGTRKREAEADRLGAQYALRAGYDPRGLATFFDKLAAGRGHQGSRLDTLFSDHPRDEVRVANVGEMVDYFLPRRDGLIVSSPEYEKVKRRLAELPPPKMAGETAANALFSSFKAANEQLVWGEFLEYLAAQEAEAEEKD